MSTLDGLRSAAEFRFWAKVDQSAEGCWIWPGQITPNGYGRFKVGQSPVYAHRYAYQTAVGPIPDGLTIDHLCRARACVRPDHLEAVPLAENIRRGGNAAKTHCKAGHEFTAENTYSSATGWRRCRTCIGEYSRARRTA